MTVLLNSSARVAAISATGPYGQAQIEFMRRAGTNVVAGVSPGRGGACLNGTPLFDTVAEAVAGAQADTALIYTPASGCADTIVECARAGIRLGLAAAEFVPVHDSLNALAVAREHDMWVVGPNTAGMSSPGEALLGSIPPEFTMRGRVGLMGRSGTLTMTVARILTRAGIGQSTVIHIGGDTLAGRNPHEWLGRFLDDDGTDCVVYCGEIGGSKEYAMLDAIAAATKPVLCFVAGRHAPAGKRMGHAGALVGSERETAGAKAEALAEAGAIVVRSPYELPELILGFDRAPN